MQEVDSTEIYLKVTHISYMPEPAKGGFERDFGFPNSRVVVNKQLTMT